MCSLSDVLGGSTRRMERLVQTLGIEGVSKSRVSEMSQTRDETVGEFCQQPLTGESPYVWLDALVINRVGASRQCGGGRGDRGPRERSLGDSGSGGGDERRRSGLAFLRGLISRGLKGVRLVISDAHPGLKDTIASSQPGASWQRCKTHFLVNLLTRVPKSAQHLVATMWSASSRIEGRSCGWLELSWLSRTTSGRLRGVT